ncbi:Cullin-4 [Trichostrongylus colubriformis]|uniref:Cullin-4 n=1 Tax=Trichostrongylus colubriformis TaxID=6319 RepID=A0AAN8G117_TRICO
MLRTLDLYKQAFEDEFLSSTSVHYTRESLAMIRSLETVDFLLHVERRMKEENERVDLYLDESTRTPLLMRAEKCLISDHMQEVVDNGLSLLLNDNRVSDVSRLYSLLSRVDGGVSLLRTGFSSYIKKVGKAMIMDPQRDPTMVEDLMVFKDKLDVFVETCFGSTDDKMKFAQAEKDAFDFFINTRGNKPAELIAKFMDARLRSANKEASDEQLDQLMNKVITLFRFIQGKDVFEVFYKKDLAKRLLLGRSASVDAEKIMLSKLRQECGAGFTQKLEGMFRDMELSKDLGVAFRNYIQHESSLGRYDDCVECSVNVLTMGQWPAYDNIQVTLPHHLSSSLQLYEKFYDSRHTGRKLQWQPRLGQCVLKATFRKGCQKELKVSLFQAIVLLLFNDQPSWTAADIMMATKLEHKEFVRTMVSLSVAKVRVLLKTPMNKEIKDDDVFTVNTDIKEMRFRIRISEVQMKETEEEYKAVEEEVNQDRQYQIDAAIVRVMKTRKKLNHQLLISELFAQLRFPVRAADLKKRIGLMATATAWLGNPAIRRYLMYISYDGSRFPEMATGGTGLGVVDMLYQAVSDSLFGARPHAHPPSVALRISPSSRRYTYRIAVCRDWDIWESIRESPSRACFSEKDYAWRLPPGFSPEKASDVCKIFEGEPISVSNDIYDYYNVTIVSRSFVREQKCALFTNFNIWPKTLEIHRYISN